MISQRSTPAPDTVRLRVSQVAKSFGGIRAIRNADIEVRAGQVHALVGENGAGKSTLIKIIAGAEAPDRGVIMFEGKESQFRSAADALSHGIATVYQEAQLFGGLSVAENIFLGQEIKKGPMIDWRKQGEHVRTLLAKIGLPEDYGSATVNDLSAAEQQQVSIAKALHADAKVLILDEPSAILTDAEIQVLFKVVRNLAQAGVSIIYITHRLDELFEIADTVTVMRDGETLGSFDMADMTIGRIAELLVGSEFSASQREQKLTRSREVVLTLENIASGHAFHGVTLDVAKHEIVVLYGLVGSGASDIADAVYGMRRLTDGKMWLKGRPFAPQSAKAATAAGVAMVPANRKRDGLFGFQSISFNISSGHLQELRRLLGWTDTARESSMATSVIDRLAIKTPNAQQRVMSLSGGNAQKVVMGRAIVGEPDLLILSEPSQGVDIKAKEEIHTLIEELSDGGTAVLVATSDIGEAIRIADRLIVIRNGEVFTEFEANVKQSAVLAAASGEITPREVNKTDEEQDS